VVSTNASDYGLGWVFIQIHSDHTEHIVGFTSKTLTPIERKYSTVEKEALGCVWAVENSRTYLWGQRFTLTQIIILPKYHQHVGKQTCGSAILDHAYSCLRNGYKALLRPPFGKSDHSSVLLLPTYRQKLKQAFRLLCMLLCMHRLESV